MSDSNTKPIAAGLVAVANKAWDEEVSATSFEDDHDVPCRPSPLTRQVACAAMDCTKDDSKLFVKRTIIPITQMKETPPTKDEGERSETSMWGAHMFPKPGEWKCDVCLTRNPPTALIECLSCEAEKKLV